MHQKGNRMSSKDLRALFDIMLIKTDAGFRLFSEKCQDSEACNFIAITNTKYNITWNIFVIVDKLSYTSKRYLDRIFKPIA